MKGIQLDNYDLSVPLRVDDVLAQNQAILLQCQPGEIKERPVLGVGITDMLHDHNPILWRKKIRETMQADGQTVGKVQVSTSGISIESQY